MNASPQATRFLIIGCITVGVLFALAYMMPAHFWGIHFHAYLPIFVTLGALPLGLAISYGLQPKSLTFSKLSEFPSWIWSLTVAVGMWFLYYNCVEQTQLYGDTHTVLSALGEGGAREHFYHLGGALSPNILSTQNGEQFTYSLVAGIQSIAHCSLWGAFRILAAALGLMYAFVWMEFVQRKLKTLPLRILGATIGLTAGITQVFYGHVEVYAAPILIYTSYLIVLVQFLESRERKWLIGSGLLLLLVIRAHSAGYALAPTFFYALLVHWAGDHVQRQAWLQWRRAGAIIPAASLLLGAVAYFTVFKAGGEHVTTDGKTRNIFLTLFGDKTPDNAYAMFSGWHIWDLVQELLLCSAPAVAILIAWALGWRLRQAAHSPALIAVSMAGILLGALNFAIDPWLSMPRDWDLCGFIAAPLLVLAVLYLSAREDALSKAWLPTGMLMAIGILQISAVAVNNNVTAVHLRLMDVCKHVFISGHGGGGYIFRNALDALPYEMEEKSALGIQTLAELKPFVASHNASDHAFMCQYAGSLAFLVNDFDHARSLLKSSLQTAPTQFFLFGDLAGVELHDGDAKSALQHGRMAMRLQPNYSGNFEVSYQAAVALGQTQDALDIGQDYLKRFPADPRKLGAQIAALTLPKTDSLPSK